ncbi:hypothetical protein F4678DRAFT_478772 [Xylaria arbuscula]|nr:hypothetical protein F4678DRAFT_478772 [Xylaria arbuscula]
MPMMSDDIDLDEAVLEDVGDLVQALLTIILRDDDDVVGSSADLLFRLYPLFFDQIRQQLIQQLPPPLRQNQRDLFLQAYNQKHDEFLKSVQDQIHLCQFLAPDHFTENLYDNLLNTLEDFKISFHTLATDDFDNRVGRDSKDCVKNKPVAEPDDCRSENKNIGSGITTESLEGTGSCTQSTGVNDHRGRRKTNSSLRRLWNHLTISRDDTSASDLRRDLLAIVFSPGSHLNKSDEKTPEETVNEAATLTPNQLDQLRQQEALALYNQTRVDHHHYLIENQAVRLQQIQHKMGTYKDTHKDLVTTNRLQPSMGSLDTQKMHAEQYNEGGLLAYPCVPTDIRNQTPASLSDSNTFQKLMGRITSLEAENQKLKTVKESQARYQNLYSIMTDPGKPPMAFLDEPRWSIGPKGEIVLTAHFPITDIRGYLSQKHDVAFVVARHYTPITQENEVQSASQAKQPLPKPKPSREFITLESQDMIRAAEEFFARQATFSEDFPLFNIRGPIQAPYVFWYCYRSPRAFQGMSDSHRRLMELLTSWIDENYGTTYDLVARQKQEGVVSQETMPFLVRPGDVLVWEVKGELNAVIAWAWPTQTPYNTMKKNGADWTKGPIVEQKTTWKWSVDTWKYKYDGQFFRHSQVTNIVFESNSSADEKPILNLSAYPLHYAPKRLTSTLETRGKTFWHCRYKKLVSHNDETGFQVAHPTCGPPFNITPPLPFNV